MPAFGEGDSGVGGYVGIDAVVGILQSAQQAQHLADDEGGTNREGVVGHHRHTLFHQFCRNAAAFLVVPYQHGDVAETGAGGTCSAHGFHYGRDFFALVAEAHLNMAGLAVVAADGLFDIRVEVIQAVLLRGIPEEVVVELHHLAAAAAVFLPGLNLGSGEGLLHAFGKQPPVGVAPAVDALLHVAHYQRTVACSFAFPEQRQEILPLHVGCILELVQQEVFVAHAQFFVHEGGVAAGYDAGEQGVAVVQAENSLFLEKRFELCEELAGKAQAEYLGLQNQGSPVDYVFLSEQIHEGSSFGCLGKRRLRSLERLEPDHSGVLPTLFGFVFARVFRKRQSRRLNLCGEILDNLAAGFAYGGEPVAGELGVIHAVSLA